jgi:hypothetical protein
LVPNFQEGVVYTLCPTICVGAILDAVDHAEKGLIDANLGGGVIKQRIARAGEGKFGILRSVVPFP